MFMSGVKLNSGMTNLNVETSVIVVIVSVMTILLTTMVAIIVAELFKINRQFLVLKRTHNTYCP
jgi:predicted Na+-dependent transporter